jgi:threonine/homoserine/homoserine lactone efflux protein
MIPLPLETAWVFFAASVALAVAPGPDNIFVLAQSAMHGPRAGLLVTVGLCTGLVGHTAAVALGVAAVFATSAVAFTVLKFVGAGYLLWLAWGAFRAGAAELGDGGQPALGARALYLRGVVMNLTNPKVAIFFLAFLPQFADPARGALAPQIVFCGVLFMISALLVFGTIAWTAGRLGERLRRSPRAQVALNRLAGLVFVGLALRLATSAR